MRRTPLVMWDRVVLGVVLVCLAGCGDDASGSGSSTTGTASGTGPTDGSTTADVADGSSTGETEGPAEDRFEPLRDAVTAYMADANIPGAAIAIIEGGEVTFAEGFGRKRPDQDDPVLPTTLFRCGSVTKTMTTIALLQQVDAGTVDLDAVVVDYVPELSFSEDPQWVSQITVHHVLTHQSGLRDRFPWLGTGDDDELSQWLVEEYADEGFMWVPPGTMWNYSNPGFTVVGRAIETASGRTYREYLSDRVWAPLGMERTFLQPADVLADGDYASGLKINALGQPVLYTPEDYDHAASRPAGLAFTHVGDLAKLIGFLRAGNPDVLSEEGRRRMATAYVDTEEIPGWQFYGYGLFAQRGYWYVPEEPDDTGFMALDFVFHGGDVPGFSADIVYFPSLDFGIAWLANADRVHVDPVLTVALSTRHDLPTPAAPPDFAMDPATLPLYAGTYDEPRLAGPIEVTWDGTDMRIDYPGLGVAGIDYDPVLLPGTPHNFRLITPEGETWLAFLHETPVGTRFVRERNAVWSRRAGPSVSIPPADVARSVDEAPRIGPHRGPTPWSPAGPRTYRARR